MAFIFHFIYGMSFLLTGQAAASSPETKEKKAEADVPLEPSDENEPAVLPLSPVDQTQEDDEGGWQQVRKIKGKKAASTQPKCT